MNRIHTMVGLAPVKEQIDQLAAVAEIEADRKAQDLPVAEKTMHLVFTGAPGTGKTTIAREIGQLYNALGILPTDGFKEISRADLVAPFVGQTAERVQDVFFGNDEKGIEPGIGGVIFIDEAYSLYNGDQDTYGKEAITELLRLAENNRQDTVVIMAGYGDEMKTLFESNPGLDRRFPTTLTFPEMGIDDRYKVMSNFMKEGEYKVGQGKQAEATRRAIMEALTYTGAGNAGDVRNLYERITAAQSIRLRDQKRAKGTLPKGEYSRITVGDVHAGTNSYANSAKVKNPLRALVPTSRKKSRRPPKAKAKGRLELVA